VSARESLLIHSPHRHWLLAGSSSFQVPAHWRPWLYDSGSLSECWQYPSADEARALGISPRRRALIREVELLGRNAEPWVFARTVIPATTLTGVERRLLRLGSRSLGSYLFRDPSLERAPLRACRLQDSGGQHYWARRSVFRLHHKPLLVCEVFLPAMEHVQYPL
jgi:chorismate--pyruvate lyase